MTDQELAKYLAIDAEPRCAEIIAAITPERRAAYERMAQVETEIGLWQAGLGPRPANVLICTRHGYK